jgi:hypothetical protein
MERVTRRTCITMGAVPALAGAAAYAARETGVWPDDSRPAFKPAGSAREALQRAHLPNVALVTHEGKDVRFYDDLVRDKKVVLSFFSSHALEESFKVHQNLAAIQRLFGNRIGRDM